MMPRIFWESALSVGETIHVSGSDGHHFARVLRANVGETASIAAAGRGYLAVIRQVDGQAGTVRLEVTDILPQSDAQHRVYLLQAAAKADKLETIVQKCTEVGIAGVVVFESKRSVVKLSASKRAGKLERWNKVAKEAAIQCQRDTIPVVQYAEDFEQVRQWLETVGKSHVLLLDEAERSQSLRQSLRTQAVPAPEEIASVVVVGPEGGWDDSERTGWTELGAVAVTLGPRILRTETAGLAATAAILYEYGDLGG